MNSEDGSFSVAAPEGWRAVNNVEGPVVSLARGSGEVVIRRGVAPFDPALKARTKVRWLGYVESCTNRTDYPHGRHEEWTPLLISTISLRQDWPVAYAVTGGCSIFELPEIFFSDGNIYSIANCRFSELGPCAEVAASVGPPVAEVAAFVPAAKAKLFGLEVTLPSAVCGALKWFAEGLERWLVLLVYSIAGIPIVLFFYLFSLLFYQSVAAGSIIAFLTGWLLARRPKARRRLLYVAVIAGLFFSWDSANIPGIELRSAAHGDGAAVVVEGWISSALVILSAWLGMGARRRYEQRNS